MKDAYKVYLEELLNTLIHEIVGDVTLDIQREGDQWRVNIITDKPAALIGTGGETIKSIQHILRVLTHKKFPEDRSHFLIDVSNFRLEREKLIKQRARRLAQFYVISGGQTAILVGLNSYERKLIHDLVADVDGVETTSVGVDDSRKLIMRPTSNAGSGSMDNAKVIDIFKDTGTEYPDTEDEVSE